MRMSVSLIARATPTASPVVAAVSRPAGRRADVQLGARRQRRSGRVAEACADAEQRHGLTRLVRARRESVEACRFVRGRAVRLVHETVGVLDVARRPGEQIFACDQVAGNLRARERLRRIDERSTACVTSAMVQSPTRDSCV
jgi:hypothetical protein